MSRASMVLEKGLSDYQVLPRGKNDTAYLAVTGKCEKTITGEVLIRVLKEGKPAGVSLKRNAGKAQDGLWSARVKGIPTGGEYTIEFSIRRGGEVLARTAKRHVLVGDIWVLAGQSNMAGSAQTCIETSSRWVHVFDLADKWQVAEDPLHWNLEAVDEAFHPGFSKEQLKEQAERERATRKGGAGPGLTFAKEINRVTGVPIGLIPCALGGTELAQWSPTLKKQSGKSLYGALIRRVEAVGREVKGILWYQGESDSWGSRASKYARRFNRLVKSLRCDIGEPNLPIIWVQLSRVLQMANPFDWNVIQDLQRRLESEIPVSGLVPTVDLPLDDLIHLSAKAQLRLGKRFANVARRIVYGDKSIEAGPRLKRVYFLEKSRTRVAVEYSGVNGRLLPEERVSGFSVWQGVTMCPIIFEAAVDEKKPNRVILSLTEALPPGAKVMYGFGLDPYCNLVDELDMAAPVFLPVEPKGCG